MIDRPEYPQRGSHPILQEEAECSYPKVTGVVRLGEDCPRTAEAAVMRTW